MPGACSVVVGSVGCYVHRIPGSGFGFPAQANQAFHHSAVGELVKDVFGKDKALKSRHAFV